MEGYEYTMDDPSACARYPAEPCKRHPLLLF